MDEHLAQTTNSLFRNNKVTKKDFFPQTQCLHSRKMMNLLDFTEMNKGIKSLERHVARCGDCQKQYIAAQHYLRLSDEAIPAFRPNAEALEALMGEVREILSRIDFSSEERTFIQKKNVGEKVKEFVDGLLDVAISWRMVPVYLTAGALFTLLIRLH